MTSEAMQYILTNENFHNISLFSQGTIVVTNKELPLKLLYFDNK